MKIMMDLAYIEKMDVKREIENVEFRYYLKFHSLPSEEIDAIVHRILAEVTPLIDCTKCGNCCEKIRPTLDEEDIITFAEGLGIPVQQFKTQFLVDEIEHKTTLNMKEIPCPFLMDHQCTNYEHRPKECQSYPHLHKAHFTSRLFGVLQNYGICPIVFNVYERLKAEL
jgi:uncharacterized protein